MRLLPLLSGGGPNTFANKTANDDENDIEGDIFRPAPQARGFRYQTKDQEKEHRNGGDNTAYSAAFCVEDAADDAEQKDKGNNYEKGTDRAPALDDAIDDTDSGFSSGFGLSIPNSTNAPAPF
jgi:hypothetical protein